MANFVDALNNIFFGTNQSKYAASAIFLTIALLCFYIIFSSSDIPVEQRIMVVFFLLLSSIPSVLFALFELTCLSAGSGNKSVKSNWCGYLAWFITIVIVIYCILIMIAILMSMSNYSNAMTRIIENNSNNRLSNEEANEIAKSIMIDGETKLDNSSQQQMVNESKDLQQLRSASVESVDQQPHYNASNMPYAEAAGYDSSDIYVSVKDNEAYVPSVPKIAPIPKIELKETTIPEAFTTEDSLHSY